MQLLAWDSQFMIDHGMRNVSNDYGRMLRLLHSISYED